MTYYTTPSLTVCASLGRGFDVILPNSWTPTRSYRLVGLGHSYGQTGSDILTRTSFSFAGQFDDGFIIMAPTAVNTDGGANKYYKYWDQLGTDDFLFWATAFAETRSRFNISSSTFLGYSNSAFMGTQLSLVYPTMLDALITIAGGGGVNDSTAVAVKQIARLHCHGDADTLVLPAGDPLAATLPGSLAGHGGIGSVGYVDTLTTVAQAAARNGDASALGSAGAAFGLWTTGTDPETTVRSYAGPVSLAMAAGAAHSLTVEAVSATRMGGTYFANWIRSVTA